MFVSSGQVYVFFSCLSFGIGSGVLFSVITFVKKAIKIKVLKIFIDVCFFILLSVAFSCYAFLLKYPSTRVYMIVGVILGLYIYAKSFHFMLAKIIKRLYNITRDKKRKKKEAKDERAKAENQREKV